MNPPTVYTYRDMTLALDGHSVVCRRGDEAIGGIFRHDKVVIYKGQPCLVELTWNPESACWEGTICGVPQTQCP